MIVKKNRLVLIFVAFLLLSLQGCTFLNSKIVVQLEKQRAIYDSINYKGKEFNVNLYSTLVFHRKEIFRKEYNDFFIVIKNDTFPLVPEINSIKIRSKDSLIRVEYLSYINFKSKKYDNDSISKIIATSSKVVNSDGITVIRKDNCDVLSFIAVHNRKTNKVKTE